VSSPQQLPKEPLEAALEAVRRLDQALRASCMKGGNLKADALARRAKDAPQLILQSGLVPALAFMLSKLTDGGKRRAYSDAVNVILGRQSRQSRDAICKDLSGEGGGYPHVAALLIAYASTVAGCGNDVSRLDSGLVACLEKITSEGVSAERLVLKYAEEVKKLATALYG